VPRPPLLSALATTLALATPGSADQPLVAITGGVQEDNRQFFVWTVTNRHTAPIVFVEFPHYRADSLNAPAGWSQEWKNRAMLGGKDAPGWVRATVADALQGIRPGGSATFELRLARGDTLTRRGNVTVRFADGTQFVVAGVQVPAAPSFLERYVMVFGLAAIFIIAVLVHVRRRPRLREPAAPSANGGLD